MIIAWLQAQAAKLFGGLAAALFLSTVTLFFLNKGKAEKIDDLRTEIAAVELRLEASNASINALEAVMAEMVADGEMRAERLDTALSEVAEETRPLLDQADALERGELSVTEVEGL